MKDLWCGRSQKNYSHPFPMEWWAQMWLIVPQHWEFGIVVSVRDTFWRVLAESAFSTYSTIFARIQVSQGLEKDSYWSKITLEYRETQWRWTHTPKQAILIQSCAGCLTLYYNSLSSAARKSEIAYTSWALVDMLFSSKPRSMCKLEISRFGCVGHSPPIKYPTKEVYTWILWARISSFDFKKNLDCAFVPGNRNPPSENRFLCGASLISDQKST